MHGVTRDVRPLVWLATFGQDLRYALRQFRLRPGFTFVVILSLACGIGANTAIFSVINALLFKSLPVHDPKELVQFNSVNLKNTETLRGFSYPGFKILRKASAPVLTGMFAYAASDTSSSVSAALKRSSVVYRGDASIASGMMASADMYSVLGVEPVLGRLFVPEDDRVEGGSPVLVLSYGYWQAHFGGDRSIIGKTVTVNRVPFTVIGVTPPEFRGIEFGSVPDFTVPLFMAPVLHLGSLRDGGSWWLGIFGRKRSGTSDRQVETALQPAFHQAVNQFLQSASAAEALDIRKMVSGLVLTIEPANHGGNAEVRDVLRRSFVYLMAMMVLLLGIACANVANLVLALTATRQNEIRLRASLGAGSARLWRQLLTETLLLALTGGALALPCAWWGGSLLVKLFADQSIARALNWSPDWRIFVFTFSAAVLAGVFVGVAPALQSAKIRLDGVVREGRSKRRTGRAPSLLVVTQIAVALLLIVGAGLLVRSFQNIRRTNPGFHSDRVLVFDVIPSVAGYSGAREQQFYKDLAERLTQMPGADSASFARFSPGSDRIGTLVRVVGDRPRSPREEIVGANMVAAKYFETVGIDLILGRTFSRYDAVNSTRVAIVNQSFARQYFGAANPLGRKFMIVGGAQQAIEIVGVVKDVKEHGLLAPAPRMLYLPYNGPDGEMTFFVHTRIDPMRVIASVRRQLRALDPLVPLTGISTLDLQLEESVAREHVLALLSSIMGLLAVVLASIGLYGVLAYSVSRETKSIGIRMALGAEAGEILWSVFRRVLPMVLSGLGIGLAGVFGLSRYLKSFLYDLTPTDPTSIAISTSILLLVAVLAAYLPARRAARLDPTVALRHE